MVGIYFFCSIRLQRKSKSDVNRVRVVCMCGSGSGGWPVGGLVVGCSRFGVMFRCQAKIINISNPSPEIARNQTKYADNH
jgi:hypothetical protein